MSKPLNNLLPLFKDKPATDKNKLSELKATDICEFNASAERRFLQFVCELLDEFDDNTAKEIIQDASFELNISVSTAKRYLIKHTARRASLVIIDGFVRCKAHQHPRKH